MTAAAIGFVTTKAPRGGYSLSRITGLEHGQAQSEVVAYTSSLIEAQAIEHQLKREMFGEPAWYSTPYREQAAMGPLSPPMPQDPLPSEYDPGSMPRVVEEYAENGGLMGKLQRDMNGVIRAFMPMAFIASLWVAANLRPLVS